ncbi:MAG: response regulator [Anaerolineae bacterium]|jgi:CheY-like chemotaxis protein|nr:response regulator [Anaerolineae bacterium]
MSDNVALVIEDTDANRIFFERLLGQAGFKIYGVASGAAALEQAGRLSSLALAVIDMEIPDLNGLELTLRLRRAFPQACLIVATMYDEPSLMQSAFDKGCDVFLVKPHGFMDLFKRLTAEGAAGLHAVRPLVIDQYGPRAFKSVLR